MPAKYDYFTIGPAPWSESCAQVGNPDYARRAKIETKAFVEQILRAYPKPENVDAQIRVKSFPHDFGYYHEVVVQFNSLDEASIQYGIQIENDEKNCLESWDTEAKNVLKSHNIEIYEADYDK